jgi:hypothetical protein
VYKKGSCSRFEAVEEVVAFFTTVEFFMLSCNSRKALRVSAIPSILMTDVGSMVIFVIEIPAGKLFRRVTIEEW